MNQLVTYDRLISAAQANQEYLDGKPEHAAEQTEMMAWRVLDTLSQTVPGVVGGFGLGFPFHSMTDDKIVIPNPEFQRYNETFIERVAAAKDLAQVAIWECSPCQQRSEFTPADCSDCTLVTLKPRQVMKLMPDLDIFVIAKDIAAPTLAHVQDTARKHQFTQSDFDATHALDRIENVMAAFAKQQTPDHYLPVDIHLIQEKAFLTALQQITDGEQDVSLPIRSMYAGWKANKKIDFWFDFTFSGTFNDSVCSPEIITAVETARQGLTASLSNDQIEQLVRAKSRRANVLLDHPPTRQLLHTRLNQWRTI